MGKFLKKTYQHLRSLVCFLVNNRQMVLDYYSLMGMIFVPLCILAGTLAGKNYYIDASETLQIPPLVVSSMNDPGYKYCLVVEMTVASLLMIDAAIDNFSNSTNIFSTKGSLINMSFLISILLASTINFFVSIPNNDYVLINTIIGSRIILTNCAIFSYSYRYGNHIWKSWLPIILVLLGGCLGPFLRVVSFSTRAAYTITLWIFSNAFNARSIVEYSSSFLICTDVIFTSFVVLQAMHQTRVIRKESNKYKVGGHGCDYESTSHKQINSILSRHTVGKVHVADNINDCNKLSSARKPSLGQSGSPSYFDLKVDDDSPLIREIQRLEHLELNDAVDALRSNRKGGRMDVEEMITL
eukprot:gene9841-20470_t